MLRRVRRLLARASMACDRFPFRGRIGDGCRDRRSVVCHSLSAELVSADFRAELRMGSARGRVDGQQRQQVAVVHIDMTPVPTAVVFTQRSGFGWIALVPPSAGHSSPQLSLLAGRHGVVRKAPALLQFLLGPIRECGSRRVGSTDRRTSGRTHGCVRSQDVFSVKSRKIQHCKLTLVALCRCDASRHRGAARHVRRMPIEGSRGSRANGGLQGSASIPHCQLCVCAVH